MESKQPSPIDLLVEAHAGLERQGPGCAEETGRALAFLGDLDLIANAADLGCGTGAQTLLLAQHLKGSVVGLDLFPAFVDVLNGQAREQGVADRVRGVVGSMDDLPFQRESLDLIWSEGAIDNIGFEKGLAYWRGFLQRCGYQFVAAFVLPETCWTDEYFTPREAALEGLLRKYPGNETVEAFVADNRHEVELYQEYQQHYGYVFYLGRKR